MWKDLPKQIQKCLWRTAVPYHPTVIHYNSLKVEKYLLVFLGALIQLPAFSHVLLSCSSHPFQVVFRVTEARVCPLLWSLFFLRRPLPRAEKFCGNQSLLVPCDCFPRLYISNTVAQFEHLVKTFKITQWKSFKQGAAVLEKKPAGCSPLSQQCGGKLGVQEFREVNDKLSLPVPFG